MTKDYVVGFAFNQDHSEVVLVRKNRPNWQAGWLNGVGGKIEYAESPREAMVREFAEEAGLITDPRLWRHVCTIRWQNDDRVDETEARVFFYAMTLPVESLNDHVVTVTDEVIEVHATNPLPTDILTNLTWIIPLSLYTGDRYAPFEVQAQVAEIYTNAL